MPTNYMIKSKTMANSIWNTKFSGIFGALCNVLAILWAKLANFFTTRAILGNIKSHGKRILVMRGCAYRHPDWIELGDNVIIGKNTTMTAEICKDYNNPDKRGYFVVKPGASIGNNCEIDFSGGVILGKESHIAHSVLISTHDHGYNYKNTPVGKSLEICDGAFVGSRSIIMHNCNRIGKNAVIGTGSVVTKDVPDYAVVAGNPARIIRYLNDEK